MTITAAMIHESNLKGKWVYWQQENLLIGRCLAVTSVTAGGSPDAGAANHVAVSWYHVTPCGKDLGITLLSLPSGKAVQILWL